MIGSSSCSTIYNGLLLQSYLLVVVNVVLFSLFKYIVQDVILEMILRNRSDKNRGHKGSLNSVGVNLLENGVANDPRDEDLSTAGALETKDDFNSVIDASSKDTESTRSITSKFIRNPKVWFLMIQFLA